MRSLSLTGSGANKVNANGDHIASGLMSTRISDGGAQEAVMDPSITTGTRKSLTQLDLAFLKDLGYTVVPEPSVSFLALSAGLLIFSARRRKMTLQPA